MDFTTAQERVEARRRARFIQNQERIHSHNHIHGSSALGRLPGQDIWNAIKGREGTNPAFRVGQVDAELLDEELLLLLKGQAGEALKYFGSHLRDDLSSEILLALRVILFKLSIWDHNASYGAMLQDLRYSDARHRGPIAASPSKWQKAFYGIFSVGGRYGWTKWEEWLSSRQQGDYQVHTLSRVSSIASTTHSIAAFASFLVFLVDGRYRTLLDRLLRMRLVPPSNQTRREVSFEYLNRQLVWHAFTEFLLFLLPLVGINRWRRWISRAWRTARKVVKKDTKEENPISEGELAFLPGRTCAICYQDQNSVPDMNASGGVVGSAQTDVTNPYETIPCKCVYCFVCIATRLESEEGEGWTCLRCGEHVQECQPWAGDVLVEGSFQKKSVSFSNKDGLEKAQENQNWTEAGSDSGID